MSLIELKTEASPKELAWFGVLLLVATGIAGLMVWRATGALEASRYVWTGGALVVVVYYLVPPCRLPMFRGWMYATYPVGWVVSHVLLAVIYFGILTPIGWVMRIFGYDPLARRGEAAHRSYWTEREGRNADPSRYFRQF